MTSPSSPVDPGFVADWSQGFPPRSRRHGDVYFSADDGLAEARAVFLQGCDLPAAWTGRADFCVAELGLGAGVNLAALLDLWISAGPPTGRLHIFTIERELITEAEARRALAAWPQLNIVAQRLAPLWVDPSPGFHRLALADLRVTIDLAVIEAAEALRQWTGRADAWFLDGFSPALNPDIWREEVLDLVGARSAPGARAATYTVAGGVRRGLAAAGFDVEKRPGHGRKKERLEARRSEPARAARAAGARRIAIIGAGIAGAATAKALRDLGEEPTVYEAERRGAGASGGPCALAAPRLDAGLGPIAALFAQAARYAARTYDALPGAVIAQGSLQLAVGPRDPRRFQTIAHSEVYGAHASIVDAEQASRQVGEQVVEGLRLDVSRVLDPSTILSAWIPQVRRSTITRLEPLQGGGWRLWEALGAVLDEVDTVVLAAGTGVQSLWPALDLSAVRGQATLAAKAHVEGAIHFGGYVLPMRGGGVLFGATHQRGDSLSDLRTADDEANLAGIARAAPRLAARLGASPRVSWASVRATTRDYLPLVGAAPGAPEGLFVLGGLGSRGFCLAPLMGAHLASSITGGASPVPRDLQALVWPGRFDGKMK